MESGHLKDSSVATVSTNPSLENNGNHAYLDHLLQVYFECFQWVPSKYF